MQTPTVQRECFTQTSDEQTHKGHVQNPTPECFFKITTLNALSKYLLFFLEEHFTVDNSNYAMNQVFKGLRRAE